MKLVLKIGIGMAVAGLLQTGAPLALATNITINDGVSQGTGWYGPQEDQETEPGTVQNQTWDLEAFSLANGKLYVVSGFNYITGSGGFFGGDIFFDKNGDATWGPTTPQNTPSSSAAYQSVANVYGYDYVLHFDAYTAVNQGLSSLSYKVYAIDPNSTLLSVYHNDLSTTKASNPFRYVSGGSEVASGTAQYQAGLSDSAVLTYDGNALSDVNVTGASSVTRTIQHTVLSVDMAWYADPNMLVHTTVGCGNDNLMGQYVPEGGTTVVLLGLGLGGLSLLNRRLRK